ncbi:hypothetical protein H8B09_29805 [Paenibacillus sp. PR3]|uniref:Uncharacterized protein n=1 Tax=Paenibacillus terricola TaxID=2763503 RepID=A0ABR8N441_9BACL|nr:hypothetical protein [Paenibacillus terricola]MBD3922940.1 hypothetical protein [Paenibacillus terricola]
MNDQLGRAKELFTTYNGSAFQMFRNGCIEEYKQYNIPKQLETDWFEEMVARYTKELSIRDWNAINRLVSIAANYPNDKILKNVLSFASRNVMSSDSIVKLMYAEGIIEIINKIKPQLSHDSRIEAYKTAFLILDDIIKKPLVIDTGHELENYNMKDKKSLNERAKRSIEKIESDLN